MAIGSAGLLLRPSCQDANIGNCCVRRPVSLKNRAASSSNPADENCCAEWCRISKVRSGFGSHDTKRVHTEEFNTSRSTYRSSSSDRHPRLFSGRCISWNAPRMDKIARCSARSDCTNHPRDRSTEDPPLNPRGGLISRWIRSWFGWLPI